MEGLQQKVWTIVDNVILNHEKIKLYGARFQRQSRHRGLLNNAFLKNGRTSTKRMDHRRNIILNHEKIVL